jgi:ketosteroid isomerase-like protein
MASALEQNDHEKIRSLVARMNVAWLKRDIERLNDCFHNDVVIKGPNFQEMARGREACVKSYEDFIGLATVKEFKASEPVIDLFGGTAVASVPWAISYRMNDQDYDESGHDLLVLTREEGQWRVIWRAVVPSQKV